MKRKKNLKYFIKIPINTNDQVFSEHQAAFDERKPDS